MKINIFFILSGLLILACSCVKEPEIPKTSNKIVIGNTTIDSTSYFKIAVSTQVTNLIGNAIQQHGHCWGTAANPDIMGNHSSLGSLSNAGKFSEQITALNPGTKYYIRPYISYTYETLYGQQADTITMQVTEPTIVTGSITDITYNSATVNANITADGGYEVTNRGVCWSTSSNPTTATSHTTDGNGTGSFVSNLTGLTPNTLYYIRAYATNSVETTYGNQDTFTTRPNPILPTVTTTTVTNITPTTAISGGNVTSDGGATITARGVCWSASPNPTTVDIHTTDGSGTGSFVSNLTGLTPNTPYHVRAYAINSLGTAYGSDSTFSTLSTGFTCGSSLTINHIAGTVAPVTKTVTYGTVTNIPGETSKCWITQNLGASHMATAVNDASESSAGWYWQFNRKLGYKHDGTTRTPNTTWIGSISESSDWTGANDPCTIELGADWRVPTNTEWTNIDEYGGWTNWYGPYGSLLSMHAAWYLLDSDGSLNYRGSYGLYRSSTQYDATNGWRLDFNSSGSFMGNSSKANGLSVRCIRDY